MSLRIGGTHSANCIHPPGLLAQSSTSQAQVESAARAGADAIEAEARPATARYENKRFAMFSLLE
jgi:hypothetical protein